MERAGDLELQVQRDMDAIRTFREASDCYGTADPQGKVRCIQQMISYWVDSKGQFSTAATQQKELAKVYEQDIGDRNKAIEAYQLAAEWFGDSQPA